MEMSDLIPSWFSNASASTASSSSSSVDLSSGLDSLFGQVMQDALGKVSSSVTTVASATSGTVDSMGLLGEGLAGGLLTSFYQSKVSNSLADVFNELNTEPTSSSTSGSVPTYSSGTVSVGGSTTTDSSDITPFADGQSFSFGDALDVINPLQHIPILNYYYRNLTGDQIGFVPQVAGSTLYGGALGAFGSLLEVGATSLLGESPVEYAVNAVSGDNKS
ncbi:hypothetical protein KDN34_02265 [Shewanella yunxiaonensis]|uniref:Uncharacterized protein n=1 Tax=Shewanella yunxiaonensis TaxID=2829809 RepID=A0ABX7YU86_9GAMM|nr:MULTISPECIES: hypothetical protein [Shewanella]MDF0534768.1 hypothetical protein [Shewanella sp. A32]QUN06313.1 hypothetical protein KDN34_02265 [Shewanella yunxiaonensis]